MDAVPDLDHPTPRDREVMRFTLVRAADRLQSIAFQQRDDLRGDGFDQERAAGIYEDVSLALRSWAEAVAVDLQR